MTAKSLFVDNKPHELKLGASFDPKSGVAYHSIRCMSFLFDWSTVYSHVKVYQCVDVWFMHNSHRSC